MPEGQEGNSFKEQKVNRKLSWNIHPETYHIEFNQPAIGLSVNKLLPKGWNFMYWEDDTGTVSPPDFILIDPQLYSDRGLIATLAHGIGHARHFAEKPNEYKRLWKKQDIKDTHLQSCLTDEERIKMVCDSYNAEMQLEFEGWDRGLMVADKLGLDSMEYELEMNLQHESLNDHIERGIVRTSQLIKQHVKLPDNYKLNFHHLPQVNLTKGKSFITIGQLQELATEFVKKRPELE